jgi:hypothetical protein
MITQELDSNTTWIAQAGPANGISPVAPLAYSLAPVPGKRLLIVPDFLKAA